MMDFHNSLLLFSKLLMISGGILLAPNIIPKEKIESIFSSLSMKANKISQLSLKVGEHLINISKSVSATLSYALSFSVAYFVFNIGMVFFESDFLNETLTKNNPLVTMSLYMLDSSWITIAMIVISIVNISTVNNSKVYWILFLVWLFPYITMAFLAIFVYLIIAFIFAAIFAISILAYWSSYTFLLEIFTFLLSPFKHISWSGLLFSKIISNNNKETLQSYTGLILIFIASIIEIGLSWK